MEKKKMAKALMLTAALAGGITMAQSFYNEAHASSCKSGSAGTCRTEIGTNGTMRCVTAGFWDSKDCNAS